MARLLLSARGRRSKALPRSFDVSRRRVRGSRSFDVEACGHVFRYQFRDELRFGPPYYSLTAAGPFAGKFNKLFEGGDYFASADPHNARSDVYFFERATGKSRLRRELSVYDLSTGRKVSAMEGDLLSPYCWRPRSDELIFDPWPDRFWKKWKVRSRKQRGLIDLCDRGNSGYATSDGRYLILLETGMPFICLYDLAEDRIVHQLTKRDFRKHTKKPETLHVVRFDPDRGLLDIHVNRSRSRERRPRERYVFAARIALSET